MRTAVLSGAGTRSISHQKKKKRAEKKNNELEDSESESDSEEERDLFEPRIVTDEELAHACKPLELDTDAMAFSLCEGDVFICEAPASDTAHEFWLGTVTREADRATEAFTAANDVHVPKGEVFLKAHFYEWHGAKKTLNPKTDAYQYRRSMCAEEVVLACQCVPFGRVADLQQGGGRKGKRPVKATKKADSNVWELPRRTYEAAASAAAAHCIKLARARACLRAALIE